MARDPGPFGVPHPRAPAGEEGSRGRGGRTYSAVLLREEVGAVVQAFLRGPRGPARPGRGRSEGDTKGDISARPAGPPSPPRAHGPHRAPGAPRRLENTHHHGCSEARVSAGALHTAGPEGAHGGGRGGATRGAGPLSSPAHPAQGLGSASREEGRRGFLPEVGSLGGGQTARGWRAPARAGLKARGGAVQFSFPEGGGEKPSKRPPPSGSRNKSSNLCLGPQDN